MTITLVAWYGIYRSLATPIAGLIPLRGQHEFAVYRCPMSSGLRVVRRRPIHDLGASARERRCIPIRDRRLPVSSLRRRLDAQEVSIGPVSSPKRTLRGHELVYFECDA
jgi:hypothetical protein